MAEQTQTEAKPVVERSLEKKLCQRAIVTNIRDQCSLTRLLLQTVSYDAIENEQLGWVFISRVELNKNNIRVENKPIRLTPGMSVSVEIKTGQRKLIEYFLAQLLRYRRECP